MDLAEKLFELSPLYLSREEFVKSLEGWTLDPVEVGGQVIGCFVVRGPEMHFQKWGAAPATRDMLRRYPGSLIKQYGYATTRTPKEDARMLAFNKRLGWYEIGETEYDVLLRIDADTFKVKDQPCQL
jgi:hypothetical protein